ncbi:Uncharacterized protein involved in cytokinesis, contains TGc (transglutaminase/protease-like) domain [Mycoplasmopsis bovigenitalium]|uniref:Uncharacterized protein involved in cytokinesis, contains TGc (Transglutaminase/protease-like) domain n=1 Tax=Mycoplasmopsis bovigenitalium TaxID=2112 RepID=A0A449A8K4_9BACT|nr:transglutaminase domain-containing protein [Mycoplasmopsis bovigenitalium]VEU60587.1 Uncharacterized protein involved in cytokinesis, contains TGc (transglutaminase/protease-like) domain [Mycoplasmopsis bovigenitalium]
MRKNKIKKMSLSLLSGASIFAAGAFVFSCEVSDNNSKKNSGKITFGVTHGVMVDDDKKTNAAITDIDGNVGIHKVSDTNSNNNDGEEKKHTITTGNLIDNSQGNHTGVIPKTNFDNPNQNDNGTTSNLNVDKQKNGGKTNSTDPFNAKTDKKPNNDQNINENITSSNKTEKDKPAATTTLPISTNSSDENKQISKENENNSADNSANKLSANNKNNQEVRHSKVVDSSFYPTQPTQTFNEISMQEQEIKNKILSTKNLASNFYSHPDFKFKETSSIIKGDGKDAKKLELVDKSGHPVEGVKWFIKAQYPEEKVYSSSEKTPQDVSISITSDGVVTGKEHEQEQRSYQVWAEYKGYLFRTIVRVLSKFEVKALNEETLSIEKVREITKNWHNLSDVIKARNAYDWISKNVKYQERGDLVSDQTAYSCLIENLCVCAGYAKGFQMFMNELNIPSKTIVGALRNEWHIWNLVELEGQWYHVDVTWDANTEFTKYGTKKTRATSYTYFLVNDNDIAPGRKFNNYIPKSLMGEKYRGFQLEGLIKSEEDIRKIVEMQVSAKYNSDSKFVSFVTGNSFTDHAMVERIIKEKTGHDAGEKHTGYRNNFRTLKYKFYIDSSKINNIKTIQLKADNFKNDKSDYIIKVSGVDLPTLTKENIWVKGAYIEKVEQSGNDYLVYLSNFNNFGQSDVELSVYKIGYKFNVDNLGKLSFDVKRHNKPQAKLIGVDENSGILQNLDSGMEYRLGLDEWKDITTNQIELKGIGTKLISIRKKSSKSMMASEIQLIKPQKYSYIDKEVKVYDNKIIGVDSNMEYRLINTRDWQDINSIYLENLKPGTYEVRIKPGENLLASESIKVNIN